VIFSGPMALGALASVLAAAWKFLRSPEKTNEEALHSLYALGQRIRSAQTEAGLSEIETEIDEVLRSQRASAAYSRIASQVLTAIGERADAWKGHFSTNPAELACHLGPHRSESDRAPHRRE
jgi:hypothetical protein